MLFLEYPVRVGHLSLGPLLLLLLLTLHATITTRALQPYPRRKGRVLGDRACGGSALVHGLPLTITLVTHLKRKLKTISIYLKEFLIKQKKNYKKL